MPDRKQWEQWKRDNNIPAGIADDVWDAAVFDPDGKYANGATWNDILLDVRERKLLGELAILRERQIDCSPMEGRSDYTPIIADINRRLGEIRLARIIMA